MVRTPLDIDPASTKIHTALGLALGAKPAIKKTHAMSMLATDQPAESNSAARKRLRGARAAPPASTGADGAPPLESSSARVGKKQRPANPDYDDAYRNLLERTQGQARSQAFHRQDAQKRRAQGKTRDGLIVPPTFVNMGGAPAVAAAALAGAPTSSVGEFVNSLCAGLEDGHEEEEAGQKEEEGRRRRSGAGSKEELDDDEVVTSGPKHNPFAALGSDDEDDEEERKGQSSPGVVFQPSVLRPQALDQANTGAAEEAPTTQGGEGQGNGSGGSREKEDAWNSLSSMAALSSSLLDVDASQQLQSVSSVDKHEEKERGNDDSSTPTLPPLPIFVPLPVTATEPKGNMGGDGGGEGGNDAVGEVSADAKEADFQDL